MPKPSHAQLAAFGSALTLTSLAIMLVLFFWWNFQNSQGFNWLIWLAQSVPLLIFIPGLVGKDSRTYTWFCFVLLIYFVKAIEGVFKSTADASNILFLVAVILSFTSAMVAAYGIQRFKKSRLDVSVPSSPSSSTD